MITVVRSNPGGNPGATGWLGLVGAVSPDRTRVADALLLLVLLGAPLPVADRPPKGSAMPSRASVTNVSEKPVRDGRRDSSKNDGLGALPPPGAGGVWAIAPVPNPIAIAKPMPIQRIITRPQIFSPA
jgi:hypothetical protein